MTLAHFDHLDYHQWAPDQDVVSTDHYVVATLEHPRAELAFSGDLTRGLAGGAPVAADGALDERGQLAAGQPRQGARPDVRDSLAHVARGADTIGFFQWRQSRSGSEKFHSALVPHAGRDSARFREVCELGALAGRLGEVNGSRVEAEVAILWDYQAQWAAHGPAHAVAASCDYPTTRARDPPRAARPGHHRRRRAPERRPHGIPGRRRPHPLPGDRRARGGHRGGRRRPAPRCSSPSSPASPTEDDHVRLGGYPGAFRDLLGVRVEEFFPLMPGETVALADGRRGSALERGRHRRRQPRCSTGMPPAP